MEPGKRQSEFAVFIDSAQVFSRLEQLRYPEAKEIVARYRERDDNL
ncbi:protein of unknown function [Trichlorobacter ammonificans]|uniref:Uncharacterized protein n=1 Tax=Trichlorobacter ammonificans TaxID=2916410 RepID=A0ABN8HKK3_9BACT|nr:protein of unknown function [Trichlorobacter ammonificans]